MQNSISHLKATRNMRKQRGLAMADMALWVVVTAIIIGGLLAAYRFVKGGVSASDLGEKVTLMVSDIQKNWANANDFSSVTPTEINKLALIRPPLKFDGTNMFDAYGNQMTMNGSRTTFGVTLGGSTAPITQEDCASIVARVQPIATHINIGAAATTSAGVISGGQSYKNGAVITQAGLTGGCSEQNPIIAMQFR